MKKQGKLSGRAIAAVLAFAMMCTLQSSFAQDRWSFEFRPGVNFATEKLGNANLETGFGFEGTFAYRFMPHLSLYAGWSWNKFGSDQEIAGTKLDFEETGYTYGLQFAHPIRGSKTSVLARIGALSNHIEVEQGDDIIADTGHGFGWQIEGGLVVPITGNWMLVPGLRYRSLSRDIVVEPISTPVDLRYLSFGIGVSGKF